ncbi:MAG: hypothetical protein H0V45_10070 [Actinobacteria bacterium]|nr:hypothetical protein [Actinomycetota bacterium]
MNLRLELDEWDRLSALAIFGERDVGHALSQIVDAEECFFLASSAGMLFGLRLRDGSRVALKALRPRPGLREGRDVQQALWARGFPCPRPILGPVKLGDGYAAVDQWVDGEQRDLHEPRRRRAAAELLAELVALAPRPKGLPRVLERTGLFPEPHHPRFDFGRPDGLWIDEVAARASSLPAASTEFVAGHSDWGARHFGWIDERIAIVYDWPDSVALDTEETIVGQASVVFPSTWDLPVEPKVATPEESEAFVAEYEEAVGRQLDRSRVAAAQTYLLAYCARCELSDLDGAEGNFQAALRERL